MCALTNYYNFVFVCVFVVFFLLRNSSSPRRVLFYCCPIVFCYQTSAVAQKRCERISYICYIYKSTLVYVFLLHACFDDAALALWINTQLLVQDA